MNAIKIEATIDEAAVKAIPALRPFLGRQIELIALDSTAGDGKARSVSVDELLNARIQLPPDVGPLSPEDIERAIAEGALGR